MKMKMNRYLRWVAVGGGAAALALLAPRLVGVCGTYAPAAAAAQGSDKAAGTKVVTLAISGMTCASCSVTVRVVLKRLDGVHNATVKVAEAQAIVEYDPGRVTPEQMVQAVKNAGYDAKVSGADGRS